MEAKAMAGMGGKGETGVQQRGHHLAAYCGAEAHSTGMEGRKAAQKQ